MTRDSAHHVPFEQMGICQAACCSVWWGTNGRELPRRMRSQSMHISDGGCVAINITHQSCRETVVMFGEGFEVRLPFLWSRVANQQLDAFCMAYYCSRTSRSSIYRSIRQVPIIVFGIPKHPSSASLTAYQSSPTESDNSSRPAQIHLPPPHRPNSL
jgi:hypothetical protein